MSGDSGVIYSSTNNYIYMSFKFFIIQSELCNIGNGHYTEPVTMFLLQVGLKRDLETFVTGPVIKPIAKANYT
jgi:hypothetical protein